jgi:hypothetical protein
MYKQKKMVLLIAVFATIFTIQLGSSAHAASMWTKFGQPLPYPGSVCTDCRFVKLGNVDKNETNFYFGIFDLLVKYENDNPAGNSPTAEGTAHIGERIVVSTTITSDQVEKNGTAEIIYFCITDPTLTSTIEDAVVPNDNWTNIYWELLGFDVEYLLEVNDEEEHVLLYHCVVGQENGQEVFNCDKYYDSQAK